MHIVTIVQARLSSTRLPGKVLLHAAGQPLLGHIVRRIQSSRYAGTVIVATTSNESDDPIEFFCQKEGIQCFRGHPTDLLDRHLMAARLYRAQAVVKIPSDCPLIDPAIIDRVIEYYLAHSDQYDYVSNLHPATYPDGNDVEIMNIAALTTAWKEAHRPMEREHTTPFFWENRERFRIGNVAWESGLDYSMSHRWTLDYAEDYELICRIYDALYKEDEVPFTIAQILTLLETRPELATINQRYLGVNWYRHHLDELKTVTSKSTNPTFL
ncbi:glycosyltransferase family protein [bacterium]|nr:glycosyltransferase family protein [bacterium]NUN44311.1 glycosyltransferase family protein [bacterium]